MSFLKYFFVAVLIIFAITILFISVYSRKPIRTLLLNSGLGLSVLIIIKLTEKYTGVSIPINEYTATLSASFGLPAICSFLLLRIIFI